MACETRSAPLVFGIHRELLARHLSKGADDCGRAAGGILVEVHPHLPFAALGGSVVRLAFENGLAHGKMSCHAGKHRTRAARKGAESWRAREPQRDKRGEKV